MAMSQADALLLAFARVIHFPFPVFSVDFDLAGFFIDFDGLPEFDALMRLAG